MQCAGTAQTAATAGRNSRQSQLPAGTVRPGAARPPGALLALRQFAGNAAMHALLERGRLQAKLLVGSSHDKHEQQADAIAEEVVQTSEKTCSCGGTCSKCSGKRGHPHATHGSLANRIQRNSSTSRSGVEQSEAPDMLQDVLREPGTALRDSARRRFGSAFDSDFSGVRVHTDARAAESASAIDAAAYTVGSDIVFGSGQYAPSTPAGERLLAHELTHVIQQRGGARAIGPAAAVADGAAATAQIGVVQRQPATHTNTSPVNPNVPSEKWRQDAENAYRRIGRIAEADAVRNCRVNGICEMLLTEREAWNAYRAGRVEAKLGPPPESGPPSGGSGVAMAGMAAPALLPRVAPVVQSGAARAMAAWGVESVLVGPASGAAATTTAATTTTAVTTTGAAAGTGTAAAVGTVAVPLALGALLVVAIVDLVGYARFQEALQRAGYTILPSPLGACIQGCHGGSPARTPDLLRDYPDFATPDFGDIIGRSRTRPQPTTRPNPAPQPAPQPVPQPLPVPRRRRRNECRRDPCEHPLPITWPSELPDPGNGLLMRMTAGDRVWEGLERGPAQRAFQEEIRDARDFLVPPPNPCFADFDEPNAPYDAHHRHPMFLRGEDRRDNLCSLRADFHQLGHPRLNDQSRHLAEYVECGICTHHLPNHPQGQTYYIAGYK